MLKKLIASVLLMLMFNGCVTDVAYNEGKSIYVTGKKVVIANYDILDDDVKAKLEKIDEYATRYDTARGLVKETLDVDTEDTTEESTSTVSGK